MSSLQKANLELARVESKIMSELDQSIITISDVQVTVSTSSEGFL